MPEKNLKLETAKLNLACLKENFAYRAFFEKLQSDPYSTCPELRMPGENDDEYRRKVNILRIKNIPFFGGHGHDFRINDEFLIKAQEDGKIPTSEIVNLLDPKKDIADVASSELIQILPLLFHVPGILEFARAEGWIRTPEDEFKYQRYEPYVQIDLKPYERILKIDLTKKKPQLMAEFEDYVDRQRTLQKAAIKFEDRLRKEGSGFSLKATYEWEPYNSRERREEAWGQLEVWKLRKLRKGFPEIARKLSLTEDVAKKRFYRAYELTQGRPYDPELYRKEGQVLTKSDLSKKCENCPDRETCKVLCPDAIRFVDQDQISRKEKFIPQDSFFWDAFSSEEPQSARKPSSDEQFNRSAAKSSPKKP